MRKGERVFSLVVIVIVLFGPFVGTTSLPTFNVSSNSSNKFDLDSTFQNTALKPDSSDGIEDSWKSIDSAKEGATTETDNEQDPLQELYSGYDGSIKDILHPKTQYYDSTGEGLDLDYSVQGNRLIVQMTIGSYDVVSYEIGSSRYQTVMVENMELTHTYGKPMIPYYKDILSLPVDAELVSYGIHDEDYLPLSDLSLMPGPKPYSVSQLESTIEPPFFDPAYYASSQFIPTDLIEIQIVGIDGKDCIVLTFNPLQYNAVQRVGNLILKFQIELKFDDFVNLEDFQLSTSPEPMTFGDGEGYLIVVDDSFMSSVLNFADWKSFLGFNVFVTSIQDIRATYPGRDAAEQLRNYLIDSYYMDSIDYVLLVGDGDIVPAREVWDPANAGQGLDNGTEASDLYFECLDGDWDANGNDLFGEMSDDVDFYPELMVGRIPVQTPQEAEDVLNAIVALESNPEPGDWMNDFLLLGPNCFAYGDGAAMTEAELNQPYLIGSFFDVDRLYPTDGTLNNINVINRINQGVGIIDFFDHGAYDVWVDSLSVPETLGLVNGYRTPFAFAMACETAAFDYEAGEPTIAEAFFRNPNGGVCAYIGATRIAWAGYYAFDGLHNRFWSYFFDSALSQFSASPKAALRDAVFEMATTYDMEDPISRETVIHAIYFGDPSMQLYWKQEVDVFAPPCETNEYIDIGVNCTTFNGLPLFSEVMVQITDPLGTAIVDDIYYADWGWFEIPLVTTSNPGSYSISFTFSDPFNYTTERIFQVGLADVEVLLETEPIYDTFLEFSGFSSVDGIGTAYLIDNYGTILSTNSFEVIAGEFYSGLNITGFGHLSLYVQVISPSGTGASFNQFDVMRGSVLIIPDESGGWGPWYPGGWVDDNAGDSTNYGDIYQALKDEFYVDIFRPRYELVPDLSYLQMYDAVIVTVGDHMSMPLIAPDSYLLDVLMQYHESGGNLFFEGCSILTPLVSDYESIFSSFFHVELDQRVTNSGNIYLDNGPHTLTSGLPSTIWLEDGLGSPLVEVIAPTSGSVHVSGYSGSVSGGTAIAALNPSATEGGVVFFAFSVDGISDEEVRYRLVQNAVNFLLYPSLECYLSDYALPTGTSEVIDVFVADSRTGTPIEGAFVMAEGCGVSTSNITSIDGTCSITVDPTTPGYVMVNISKEDYLGYETYIISYDIPLIGLEIYPEYIEREVTSVVTMYCYDYYEGFPLENCYLILDGCGVYDEGYSNVSGFAVFTVHPDTSGLISVNASLMDYADAFDFIGVRLLAAVVRGYFTEDPDLACWDIINSNWDNYGDAPIFIDYTSLNLPLITLSDLEVLNPDVLIMSYMYQSLDSSEIEDIIEYTRQGHGLVVTSSCISYHPELLGPFLGIDGEVGWTNNYEIGIGFDSLDIMEPGHPLFENIADPYSVGYHLSYLPSGIRWQSSALVGGTFVALDSGLENVAAIVTYRGLVYCSNIPEYESNSQDVQLVYNMIAWSRYQIPEHDVSVSINSPRVVSPGEEAVVEVTVRNLGLSTEYDVSFTMYLDGVEILSEVVPILENNTEYSVPYLWTPTIQGLYSFEALVLPVGDEDSLSNNYCQRFVNVFDVPIDGPVALFQVYDPWGYSSTRDILDLWMIEYEVFDDSSMGTFDLSGYAKVIISSDQPDWFMETLYDNLWWFEEYALNGGVLEVHAATNYYWVNGLLPGGSHYVQYYEDLISILDPYHPIMTTPNMISDEELDYWSASVHGILENIPSGCAYLLATDSGYPVLIEQSFGMGSILISTQTLEWGFGREMSRFLENVILYAPTPPDHDIAVFLHMANRISPGEGTMITSVLVNRGLNLETDIPFYLYVDGMEVNATIIPELYPGAFVDLTYWFTPAFEYEASVFTYAEPVPDEINIDNNYAFGNITVSEFHDYIMVEYDPDWFDAKTNGFNLNLAGDDVSIGLGLPFSFRFYDSFFDEIYISSNGWLSFANTNPYEFWTPPWPTSDPAYGYSLAPLFGDLQAENNIYAWVTDDWVVIQYDNYRHLAGTLMGTFQIVLYRTGIIQFNYLEMYNVVEYEIPTVGLNYGDGIFGPTFFGGDLTGISDFGLMFTYELPEHDLAIQIDVPEYVNPGSTIAVNLVVSNYGSSDEYDVQFYFYIDGILTLSDVIPYLPSMTSFNINYTWAPPTEDTYMLEAFVDTVAGETNVDNNYDLAIVQVTELFTILEPSDAEVIDGGAVLVTYAAADPENLAFIDVFVNGEFIANVPNQGLNQLIVPVFTEGYNEIQLMAWWNDNTTAWDSVIIDSANVVPLAVLEPGDYVNYLFTYEYGFYQEYNFTFGEYISEYEVEVEFIYHVYDDAGNDDVTYYYLIVNVLNGYITWSDMGWTYRHFFPFSGISAPDVISHAITPSMGTFYYWNDLYYTEDLGEWRGYQVWRGYGVAGDFECSVLESNGLLVEMYFGMPTPYCYGEVVSTNLIPGFTPSEFQITSPNTGDVIDGGLVYVEFEASNLNTLQLIDVFVNDDYITSISYPSSTSLFVPVFTNGTNTIMLIAYWEDGTIAFANATVYSENVVPIARPELGDFLNFRIESYGYMIDFNFTFGEMVSEFEVYASLHYYSVSPTDEVIEYDFELIINILNGYISYSDFGWDTYHFMFFTGISSPNIIQSYGQIGDAAPFFMWDQILTIDGPSDWNGEAVWMMSSESGDIFAFVWQSNGLLVLFDSQDPMTYGFGYLVDTNMIPPFDNVPPAWLFLPEDQYLGPGEWLYYDLEAIDPSGIDSWWIDDTVHFSIDINGTITNNELLEDGIYPITVFVNDTYGNVLIGSFNVIVESIIGPIFIDGDDDFVAYGFPGSGTLEDPYIIAGFEIDCTEIYSPCIQIQNTQAHFIVRECILTAMYGFPVIYLYNVENGILEQNICTGGAFGIFVDACYGTVIADNLVFGTDFGILVYWSVFCQVISNECYENMDGIMLSECYYCDVVENICSMNANSGIMLNGTNFESYIGDNYCSNNYAGIYSSFSSNKTIVNNTCTENMIGILLEFSYGDFLFWNYISYNEWYGLVLMETVDTIIVENFISEHEGVGIILFSSSMNTIEYNTIVDNGLGLILDTSCCNSIRWNDLIGNLDVAILMYQAEWNFLEYNIISDNRAGLYTMEFSDSNIIMWNVFENIEENAVDDCSYNIFDFNFWSDYTGPDDDHDGIGDVPYDIMGYAGNQDIHPLIYYPWYLNWSEAPSDILLGYGEALFYVLPVIGYGELWFYINNTLQFAIDGNGTLQNTMTLEIGEYPLFIAVVNQWGYVIYAEITITVMDTMPPEWIEIPEDQTVEFGDLFVYYVNASDFSGIQSYWVSNGNFTIDSNGLLTNSTFLPVGNYSLELRAYDPYDNYCSAFIVVSVVDTTPPTWISEPVDQIIEAGTDFNYMVEAWDLSGEVTYFVYPTGFFTVTPEGEISNLHTLEVGEYSLTIGAMDIYGNVISSTITLTVVDTTAPEWLENPQDKSILQGIALELAVAVYDASPIAWWSINDTANFFIDPMGDVKHGVALIYNNTALEPGTYGLEITVCDEYGNIQSAVITITVIKATMIVSPATGIIIIISEAACLIVIIIVIAIRGRRR